MKIIRKYKRIIAANLILNILLPVVLPTFFMSLTGGPASPEFSSFEPVATTDMVDLFSGDLTYNIPVLNIPGADGGGYALSMSYHSGVSSEDEASWVGLGWTLNAGAINRNVRGKVDEFNGEVVTNYNKIRPNWTVSAVVDGSIEIKSKDKPKDEPETDLQKAMAKIKEAKQKMDSIKQVIEKAKNLGNQAGDSTSTGSQPSDGAQSDTTKKDSLSMFLKFNYSKSTRFNNYRGFSKSSGYGLNFKGMGGLNMTRGGGETTFSANINPMKILSKTKYKTIKDRLNDRINKKVREGDITKALKMNSKLTKASKIYKKARYRGLSYFNSSTYANTTPSFSVSPYRAKSYNRSFSAQLGIFNIGVEAGFTGNFNTQLTSPVTDMRAYGYMYNPDLDTIKNDKYNLLGILNIANFNSRSMMDYMVEKGNDLNKRDRYIGIPFALPDNFSATGEGVGGGFNLWKRKIGNFYPNYTKSVTGISQMGLEGNVDIPATGAGIGFDLKLVGRQVNATKKWGLAEDFDVNDRGFFRFNGDMGGSVSYTNSAETQTSELDLVNFVPGTKTFKIDNSGMNLTDLDSADERRSSLIETTNYSEWLSNTNRLEKNSGIAAHINTTSGTIPGEAIVEYAVINASGNRTVYGLPVFTKDVQDLSVKVDAGNLDNDEYLAYKTLHVNADALKNDEIIGSKSASIRANTYLITQATTLDYVDIDNNGPSDNDLGGWTKFGYRKWYKGEPTENPQTDDHYRYRIPYSGLSYQKGKIGGPNDDKGSVSFGLKQMYHLSNIETKTHIAYFITNKTLPEDLPYFDRFDEATKEKLTGSGVDRVDALGALPINDNNIDPMANLNPDNASAFGDEMETHDQNLEKLEKIVLFSKDRLGDINGVKGTPLQTVNMDYSYELCPNTPNHAGFNNGNRSTRGKLTLKKLWFDAEGVVRSRIAPYRFFYEYPVSKDSDGVLHSEYGDELEEKYPGIVEGFKDQDGNELSDVDQNPDYEPSSLDMWGNYQVNGEKRFQKNQPWVYQGKYKPEDEPFDPAPWHLKRIKLPSGGLIDIQYEQKNYTYVQDKRALSMVSLLEDSKDDYKDKNVKYYLNLDDIGIIGNENITDYRNLLEEYFIEKDEKGKAVGPNNYIYFKYLYTVDQSENKPTLNSCNSEYITGYTSVQKVVKEGNKIYLQLGDDKNWKRKNSLRAQIGKNVPRHICYEYALTNMDGLSNGEYDCSPKLKRAKNVNSYLDNLMAKDDLTGEYRKLFGAELNISEEQGELLIAGLNLDYTYPTINVDLNLEEKRQFRKNVIKESLKGVTNHIFEFTPKKKNICKKVNYELSYLRLPVHKFKRGGGCRVKRLLMFDKGIETGDEHLFGTEYNYMLENGESSGVATNEPGAGREENALVGLLDRKNQKFLSKVTAGADKEQFEGPIGESILPGPSIGHSRIVVNNIHKGKTGTGHQITEYFTCKDYPFKASNTELYDDKKTKAKDELQFSLLFVKYSTRKKWFTQGYNFVLNQMHGQMKESSTYAGDYGTGNNRLVSSTTQEYYEPGEDVPLVDYEPTSKEFKFTSGVPGAEELVSMEARKVFDETIDLNLELDINLIWAGFAIKPYYNGNFQLSIKELNTHVTSKIWKYPAILKKTTSFMDNVESVSENLYFDVNTGNPIGKVVYDGYNGLKLPESISESGNKHSGALYSYTIPAAWIYKGMGQKAVDSTNTNQLSGNVMSFNTYGYDVWEGGSVATLPISNIDFDNKVLGASASTYKNDWFDSGSDGDLFQEYGITMTDELINQLNYAYRPEATFTYYDAINNASRTGGGSDEEGRIYNSGTIKNFDFFDWSSSDVTGDTIKSYKKWLYSSKVNRYSPNGNPLEEENTLGIVSAVKFGYKGNILPTIVAQNADYESIFFQDFENESLAEKDVAHSGFYGLDLNANPGYKFVSETSNLQLSPQLERVGGVVKVWLKSQLQSGELNANKTHNFTLVINGNIEKKFEKIASSGEWTQYAARIEDWTGIPAGSKMKMTLKYDAIDGELVFVDDFRFQPYDAEVMCYVYDKYSLRPMAEFGDQHFGVFYQYNNEGQLIRKTIETERGTKSLGESKINIPRESRTK